MSNDDACYIERDYVSIDKPCQDALQDEEDLAIVKMEAGCPKVNMRYFLLNYQHIPYTHPRPKGGRSWMDLSLFRTLLA